MRALTLLIGFIAASAAAFAGGPAQHAPAVAQAQPKSDFATRSLSSDELAALIGQPNLYLIDVRTAEEYRSGAIPSAVNIPFDVIQDKLPTQDRSARIVVYCQSGNRSGKAKATLESLGFQNVNDFGAVTNWQGELITH
jgi:rhodanese-related sulfurtransferase